MGPIAPLSLVSQAFMAMIAVESQYFEIAQSATRVTRDPADAATLFDRQRAIVCRDALSPDLLTRLQRAAAGVTMVSNPVEHLGHRWIEQPAIVGAGIELAINRPVLIDWLAAVVGLARLGKAEGRLVETRPGGVDGLGWHDDQIPGARLGITVHLRDAQYDGGAFELRDKATRQTLFRHAEARAGDIVMFDVSPDYEHRVMPVASGMARLVYTGWFIDLL